MKQLLQEIRGAFSLSQERFADLLGTTFATVNRWENGRTVPGRKTQDKIMRLCSDQGIQLLRAGDGPYSERVLCFTGTESSPSLSWLQERPDWRDRTYKPGQM